MRQMTRVIVWKLIFYDPLVTMTSSDDGTVSSIVVFLEQPGGVTASSPKLLDSCEQTRERKISSSVVFPFAMAVESALRNNISSQLFIVVSPSLPLIKRV